jgi:predicted Abi (CAAX) family protease
VLDAVVNPQLLVHCSQYRPLKYFIIQLALSMAEKRVGAGGGAAGHQAAVDPVQRRAAHAALSSQAAGPIAILFMFQLSRLLLPPPLRCRRRLS